MEDVMHVSILSGNKPPEALVQAARSYFCPGCTGFIELHQSGSLWTANLAHDRACRGCECSVRDKETVVIPLADAHRARGGAAAGRARRRGVR
jgi:hypothetical protein